MGCSKSNTKKEAHWDKCLYEKRKKKSQIKTPKFTPQGARKRTKLRVNRRKKTIGIIAKINKIKNIKW